MKISQWMMCAMVGMSAMQACANDPSTAPAPNGDAATVLQSIGLSDHFIMLGPSAPYDTLTINATPYNGLRQPISDASNLVFRSSDTSAVSVTPTGTIQGKTPGKSATIYVGVTRGAVTIWDSAMVQIAYARPTLSMFSASPPPPDSAKSSAGQRRTLVMRASGSNLVNMRMYLETADPRVLALGGSPLLTNSTAFSNPTTLRTNAYAFAPGRVRLYASATIGGIRYRDSVDYVVGNAVSVIIQVVQTFRRDGTAVYTFSPANMTVGLGARILWPVANPSGDFPYSVTFSDTTLPKRDPTSSYGDNVDGNIVLWHYDMNWVGPNYFRSRYFPRPGKLTFTSQELNASGSITIVDDRACQPNCPPFS